MFTPAGTGDRIYVFDLDEDGVDVLKDMAPANTGFYDVDTFISALNGKIYPIDIKTDSGQVTSEKAEDSESRTLTGTAVIDHSIDKFLAIDAAMAFMNLGVLIPIDDKSCYVIMSPYRRVKYSSNYDSGTTYDSDHGFTITFTVSPVLYACPMVKLTAAHLRSMSNTDDNYYLYTGAQNRNKAVITINTPTGGTLTVTHDGIAVTSGGEYTINKIVKVVATPESDKSAKITLNGGLVVDSGAAGETISWQTVLTGNITVGAEFT